MRNDAQSSPAINSLAIVQQAGHIPYSLIVAIVESIPMDPLD